MKITEGRLRSIIRSVIKESMEDYTHPPSYRDEPYDPPERERNALMNPSDSQVHPMHAGNRREDPYSRAVRIAKEHCPDCRFDDHVEKIEGEDKYVVYFNHQDVHVIVPSEFSDDDEVLVYKCMS